MKKMVFLSPQKNSYFFSVTHAILVCKHNMFIITEIEVYLKRCEDNVYESGKATVSNLVHYMMITRKIEYENTHFLSLSNRISKIMSAGVTHYRGAGREKREGPHGWRWQFGKVKAAWLSANKGLD